MRTIIAPVDFSSTSANAMAFAAELAKRASARLLLVHIFSRKGEEDEAKKKLQAAEADLKKVFGPTCKCESIAAQGKFIPAMKKIIDAQQPNVIVMGTKGASGLKRILIGSNTVNLLAKTTLPALVIPEEARFENFLKKGKNRIVLATDLALLKNESVLNILKEIALIIAEPRVRVLSVRPKNTKLTPMSSMERETLLAFFNPELESERITVFSDNVMSGIEFYLKKNADTGLLAMVARDSGYVVQKHYTRQMASHTQLPLLVLNDK